MDALSQPAAPRAGEVPHSVPGTLWTGLRLGLLIGPTALGVSASAVALPAIATEMRIGTGTAAWVLSAYALALGVGTVLFGRIADSWGVRTSLRTGVLLLTAGSLGCAVAPSLGVLVAGRLAQGVAAGAMASSAFTLAASAEAARRGAVIGMLTATMAVFAGGATLVGGAATVALSWRVAVALPALSLVIVPLCRRLASGHPGRAGAPVDVAGAGLLTLAAGALLVLIQARTLGLSTPLVVALAVVAMATTAAFARRVHSRPDGFLPQRLISQPAFRSACMIGFWVFGGFFAAVFLVPQMLVRMHGWGVFAVGAALLPGAVLGAVLSRFATRLAARLGRGALLTTTATTLAALLVVAGMTSTWVATMIVAASFGFIAFGITQAVLVDHVCTVTPPADRGIATGLLNFAFVTGGGAGADLAGALVRPLHLDGALAAVAVLPLAATGLAALTSGRNRPIRLGVRLFRFPHN